MSYNLFCDPAVGQTLRSDGTGADYGVISGNCSAILGGIPSATPDNTNNADLSTIVMGECNCINVFSSGNGIFNFIGNGFRNYVAGDQNTIVNGCGNKIDTTISRQCVFGSFIGGGSSNLICDDGACGASQSFIGAGGNNSIFSRCSVIAGGISNTTRGIESFIGGGESNNICVDGCYAFIGSGNQNIIYDNAQCSFIGTGFHNRIGINACNGAVVGGTNNCITEDSIFAIVGGGGTNCAAANYASVLGGSCNTASGQFSFIGGGGSTAVALGNIAAGDYSFIGAGYNNNAACQASFIGGGGNNTLNGLFSFVGGGDTNCIASSYGPVSCAVIVGGSKNVISDNGSGITADFTFIGGGCNNQAVTPFSFIGGGCNNTNFSEFSSIVGGACNTNLSVFSGYNLIGGGCCNTIANESDYSSITGGFNNFIGYGGSCPAHFSFIGGGAGNLIETGSSTGQDTFWGTISGGCNNRLGGATCGSTVAGGTFNYSYGDHAFIGGGHGNEVQGNFGTIGGGGNNGVAGAYSVIGGGCGNSVQTFSTLALMSGIFSGQANCVLEGNCSSILGGEGNVVSYTDYGFVGGGYRNSIIQNSFASAIVGGCCNYVGNPLLTGGCSAAFSFIGGGYCNCIDTDTVNTSSFNTIGAGQENYISPNVNHSSIFGGFSNSISGNCSVIAGGTGNNLSGDCSAIFGGIGNDDGGFFNVGIFGNGLAANCDPSSYGVPSAFWTDSIVAPSIPLVTPLTYPGLPIGALYITHPRTGFGSSQVFLK